MYHNSSEIEYSKPTRPYRAIIARSLSVCAGLLAFSYVFMMIQTVTLINDRKDIRESIRQTQVGISDLEIQYFKLAQSIDPATIAQLGFKESVVPIFAYTKPTYDTVAFSR